LWQINIKEMARVNLQLNEDSEKRLKKVKAVGALNDMACGNKQQQIEIAIEWAARLIESSDDETFNAITGRVKKL
jgi:hypothetical protein